MDISSLIEPGNSGSTEVNEPRPPASRRQTVSSLLNDDEPSPVQREETNDSSDSKGSEESKELKESKDSKESEESKKSIDLSKDHEKHHEKDTHVNQPRKSDPNKPKRYKIPPIYAQSWLKWSKSKSHHNGVSSLGSSLDGLAIDRDNNSGSGGGGVSLAGLPLSLTNIQPFEDLTRKITEWAYSHIYQLEGERSYVEVEFKLGTICDRSTEKRLDLPVLTETVLRTDYAHQNTFFVASMSDDMFGRANTLLDSLVSEKTNVTKQLTRTKDAIYTTKQKQDKLRVSYDETGKVLEKINKRRISDLMVYSPGDLLDFRVSISVEIPSQVNVEDDAFQRRTPSTVRNKNRQSYIQEGNQVDLTSVITPSAPYHGGNKTSTSKELEVEVDSSRLLTYFNAFQDQSDSMAMDKFEELIRLGIDNTRLITRKISR